MNMNPTPYDILAQLYERKGLDFSHYVALHLRHGFVFSTPDFFIMGRAVCRSWPDDQVTDPTQTAPRIAADAWYIHAMAGDTGKAWSILPWPLGFVGFERFDSVLRWVPTEVIRRFHPANSDAAFALSLLSA